MKLLWYPCIPVYPHLNNIHNYITSNQQSTLTAYEVTQICYHFVYLIILILTKLIKLFKLFPVTVTSCEDVGCHYLGLLFFLLWGYFDMASWIHGVTLIGFLVWYNQCETVWNTIFGPFFDTKFGPFSHLFTIIWC